MEPLETVIFKPSSTNCSFS